MRRHEVERGSDLGRGSEYRRNDPSKDSHNDGRDYHFVLQRVSNQRGAQARADEETAADASKAVPFQREQFYIRDGNAEILRLVTRGRSLDEQEAAEVAPEPEQRPMTLVPPRQHNSVRADVGKEIIMQRFMEDQRNNGSREQGEEEASVTGPLARLRQQDLLVRRILEEEARLNNTLLLTEALVAQRQHEQFLATTGENIETQSLPGQATMATQTDVDSSTQTEPFHLMRPPRRRARSDNDDSYTEEEDQESHVTAVSNSLGSALRGFWNKRRRSKRKRSLFHRGDLRLKRPGWKSGLSVPGKRHKIKTPIMEETESALEAAERQQDHFSFGNYSENKTSMLRRRNNKAKIATASGEMEVTTLPNQLQSELEDVEEETPPDSLEERSPPDRKFVLGSNSTRNYRRIHSPNISMGDVAHVNADDSRWMSSEIRHVEFENKDTRGNVSDKRSSSDIRHGAVSEKARHRDSSLTTSSDTTSGRPSENGSSAERGDDVRHSVLTSAQEGDTTVMPSERAEARIDVSASSRRSRRNSVPNDVKLGEKKRVPSRRGSLSEPGRIDPDLSQRQTAASRAKSLSQVNDVENAAPVQKKGSRYMEWYKTKREERERRKKEEEEKKKDKQRKKHKPGQNSAVDPKLTKKRENEKSGSLAEGQGVRKIVEEGGDKELGKAEEQILKVTVFDDDMDSGIAMSSMLMGGGAKKRRNQQLLEKKSVFTIAYDDMQTKQLRPDSSSPQY
jgi:hypothetical protein